MNFRLKIWRQASGESKGELKLYEVRDISPRLLFLEMLDILNEKTDQLAKTKNPSHSIPIVVKEFAARVP